MKNISKFVTYQQIQTIFSVILLILVGGVGYFLYNLTSDVTALKANFASTTTSFGNRISGLEADLATTSQLSMNLSQQISEQQNISNSVQQTIGGLSSTVNTLEKLSKTDQELLQKYSKVYFLSENYIPISLTNIDPKYNFDPAKTLQFHTFALPFLANMLNTASSSGINIDIVSAYRSFGTQSALKSEYVTTYGTGANQFSADQGYSEHQLGTAVDLTTPGPGYNLVIKFDTTPAFNWLTNNAYRYGFILSYPNGNTYYQYEPWHWRFVGVALATYLHNQNLHFYDLDQRTIDAYLANIFD